MMSFFEIPKGVLEKLDQYRSRLFWQGGKEKKNIILQNEISCVALKIKED
jgi:hypothetical protein